MSVYTLNFKKTCQIVAGGTSSLPTFLVGFGRPAAEEGIAVDTASEAVASVPDSLDYQSYLMDARYFNAFRIIIYLYFL